MDQENQDSINPYEAPKTEISKPSPLCPACGEEMQAGKIHSNGQVYWKKKDIKGVAKFLTSGKQIGKMKTGIGCNYSAHHCPSCGLYIL